MCGTESGGSANHNKPAQPRASLGQSHSQPHRLAQQDGRGSAQKKHAQHAQHQQANATAAARLLSRANLWPPAAEV